MRDATHSISSQAENEFVRREYYFKRTFRMCLLFREIFFISIFLYRSHVKMVNKRRKVFERNEVD